MSIAVTGRSYLDLAIIEVRKSAPICWENTAKIWLCNIIDPAVTWPSA